jgi:hypothetical protein
MTAGILDPGPQLSGAEVSADEQALIDRIDAKKRHTVEEVALGLGLAFIVYRLYMKRRLREAIRDQEGSTTEIALETLAYGVYTGFTPKMVRMFAPLLVQGYLLGIGEARSGQIDEAYLMDLAESYAEQLGGHLNDVSLEAAMQGYNRQVNLKVPARRALLNVVNAYGVPTRTMNSLVNVWTSEDPKTLSALPSASRRDARAAAIIDKAIATRGHQIGDTEAWTARTSAKQLVWMYAMNKGLIPPTATKVWKTAKDERVCPVCGPMSQSEVSLDEPFITDTGRVWTPPLHPDCRCDIDLDYNTLANFAPIMESELVGKAYDKNEKRDDRGRWARTQVKEGIKINLQPITLPDTVITLEDELPALPGTMPALPGTETKPEVKGKVSLGTKGSLKRVSLARVSLDNPQPKVGLTTSPKSLPKISLPKVSLPTEQQIKVSLGMPTSAPTGVNDKWVFMQEPLYAVIDSGNAVGEHAFVDDKEPFYRYADTKPALKKYWKDWVEGEVLEHQRKEMGANAYKFQDGDGTVWDIDASAFQQTLEWYLNGEEEPEGGPRATVPLINSREQIRKVDAGTLVEWLNLDNSVQEAIPTIMVTDHFNSEFGEVNETKYHGSARNPGNWRIVSAKSHDAWDFDTPLPYTLAHFEPEDLYKGD